jgi:hypothetical protein
MERARLVKGNDDDDDDDSLYCSYEYNLDHILFYINSNFLM